MFASRASCPLWVDRPRASVMLAVLADPGRRFNAIVIEEFDPAFRGDQFTRIVPMLEARCRMAARVRRSGGLDPTHRALMMLLGAQSRRETDWSTRDHTRTGHRLDRAASLGKIPPGRCGGEELQAR